MKKIVCFLVFLKSSFSFAQNNVCIVPMPSELAMGKGNFILNRNTKIILEGSGLEKTASYFNNRLKKELGFSLQVSKNEISSNKIVLNYERMDNELPGAYSMSVSNKEIYIAGDNAVGVFYGIQTLFQLLPASNKKNAAVPIPQLNISDHPRFAYRGMHLDVARHFFSAEQVKNYIDQLAEYKFNVFHWHLTDDQGWRIEIKKYPKLTSVGSYRNGTIIGAYPGTGNDSIRYGGSYTQKEIKEIVQYASDRFIEIIPEIEMPGHSSAAIAAYPELSCFPKQRTAVPANTAWAGNRKGKQVPQAWGVFEDVLCPTEYTFGFLQDVLDEVMALFPSKYIHIGGDESPKEYWKRSGFCQQLMQEKKLKNEHELQSYFISRIEKYINSKGRKIIGWDEILEGGLAPNATVMSWRGESGGIAAAKQDHDVIMTPENPLYLNHSQTKNEDSVTQGGYNPIENVYNYEPIPKELTEAQTRHILGAQGNMWSEHLKNERKLEYMLFPRIAALSEVLWTAKEKKDWKDFERRLPLIMNKLDAEKINYSKAYYDLKSSVIQGDNNESVLWKLETNKIGNDIIYLDQESPKNFIKYNDPVKISSSGNYAAALEGKDHTIVSNWVNQQFSFNLATAKKIGLAKPASTNYPGDGPFTLVNGIQNTKGMSRSSEFLGFSGTDMDATIDLGKDMDISSVILHVFDENASWIYLPRSVEVTYLAEDKIAGGKVTVDIDAVKQAGMKAIELKEKHRCRYIHIIARNFGNIPDGNPGSGNPAWLFVDEIEIK